MRRYKMLRRVRRKRVFREMQVCRTPMQIRNAEEKAKYPSHDAGARPINVSRNERGSESGVTYTVAPAYNKGAYQVIPISDIQHIGK